MFNSILYNMGLYNVLYDDDYNLINIKNTLKKTKTLKKKFYIPTDIEIQNKYHRIKLKKRPRINVTDIIHIKNNLKQIN